MSDTTFPPDLQLIAFDPAVHAPCVGLLNPKSGPRKGAPILEVCGRTEYFKDRMFDIVEVFKASFKKESGFGADFIKYRAMLNEAKAKAAEKNDPKFRPRQFIGGGDGTPSFALAIIFRTIQPDPDGGFPDTGNGFSWSDEDLKNYFPALIQMPLGTGNDLGRAVGWGPKYPGYVICGGAGSRGTKLRNWMDQALRVTTPVVNFDVFGLMPPPGEERVNVKVCQLEAVKKLDGKKQCVMREADKVAPFLVFLYCTFGSMAQIISRFENARTRSQRQNTMKITLKTVEILLGFRPKQLKSGMDGFSVYNLPGEANEKNGSDRYFPPRDGRKGSSYWDVGVMNANSISGGFFHGADRTSCATRWCLCGKGRADVDPTDGKADFFRQRMLPTVFKTGSLFQTDKKPGGYVKYDAAQGQGQFLQIDGEGRFAFSPEGAEWRLDIKHALVVPMVVSPKFKKPVDEVKFEFCGSSPEEVEQIKTRLRRWANGELISELNATAEEIQKAGFPMKAEHRTDSI